MEEPDSFKIESILEGGSGGEQEEEIRVNSPSGTTSPVLTQEEADFYNAMSARYQADNSFKNISDLSELDRILIMELMCYRWGQWIVMEQDYDGKKVDPGNLQRFIESYSKEIRGIKKDLGMDKSSRDKDKESSVADYVQNVLIRAKEFGIKRNEQAVEAITILKELQGLITLHDNSTEAERREFGCRDEEIFDWIRNKCESFDRIDAELRENQKYWVRDL